MKPNTSRTLFILGAGAMMVACIASSREPTKAFVVDEPLHCGFASPFFHGTLISTRPGVQGDEVFSSLRSDCLTVYDSKHEWNLGKNHNRLWVDDKGQPLLLKKEVWVGKKPEEKFFQWNTKLAALMLKMNQDFFRFKGELPLRVLTVGRYLLSAWIEAANLPVGGKERARVLDAREPFEKIKFITLMRKEDRQDSGLGRVRVYTIFGREPIYTNAQNHVVGDMWGMRLKRQSF